MRSDVEHCDGRAVRWIDSSSRRASSRSFGKADIQVGVRVGPAEDFASISFNSA